jgi:hypothetical protein
MKYLISLLCLFGVIGCASNEPFVNIYDGLNDEQIEQLDQQRTIEQEAFNATSLFLLNVLEHADEVIADYSLDIVYVCNADDDIHTLSVPELAKLYKKDGNAYIKCFDALIDYAQKPRDRRYRKIQPVNTPTVLSNRYNTAKDFLKYYKYLNIEKY